MEAYAEFVNFKVSKKNSITRKCWNNSYGLKKNLMKKILIIHFVLIFNWFVTFGNYHREN